MPEKAVIVDWDNIGRTRQEIPSQQLEGLWSEWAQGKGFQVSCSLGDWGLPEVYCPAFTINSKSSHTRMVSYGSGLYLPYQSASASCSADKGAIDNNYWCLSW